MAFFCFQSYTFDMKKIIWILIVLALLGGAYYFGTRQEESTAAKEIEGNKDDLVSFSVSPGEEISGVLNFNGIVQNGYFFEGNIGINILDENKKLLKAGNAMATTDWMTSEPVSFGGTIDLTGLPPGPGYIQIANDNPSDMRDLDKFIYIPVIIGQSKASSSLYILSPKEGDDLVIGQKYLVSFNQALRVSDYHPLLHTFSVFNSQGTKLGAICPEFEKVDEYKFDWVAGNLTSSCAGTGNVAVKLPQGKYQILFTELNSNGDTIGTTKSGWFNLVIPKTTYTYKNHGFTIELPNGFIPEDRLAENGPAYIVSLPTGGLTYVTDATWWEKYNITPSYTYLKSQKIGETTFTIYEYNGLRFYWFRQGDVGYEFSGSDTTKLENLMKTFKFVGWAMPCTDVTGVTCPYIEGSGFYPSITN